MTEPEIIIERKKYGSSAAMDYTMRVYQKLNEETIMIDGVKYQKIEEPKPPTLYEKLELPYSTVGYMFNEGQKEWICKIVGEWLPNDDPHDGEEYQLGWNACLEYLRKKLK